MTLIQWAPTILPGIPFDRTSSKWGGVDPLSKEGHVELSRNLQIATAVVDICGLCIFVAFPVLDVPECFEAIYKMINARYGLNMNG